MNATAKTEKSEACSAANLLTVLRWSALAVGLLVNAWAFWVMGSEIGKELFRFGRLPDVSSSTGLFEWCRQVVLLSWLPKDALHIHLSKKLVFGACNAIFLAMLCDSYRRGNHRVALVSGGLVLLNLLLIFSPAVGNLPQLSLLSPNVARPAK